MIDILNFFAVRPHFLGLIVFVWVFGYSASMVVRAFRGGAED